MGNIFTTNRKKDESSNTNSQSEKKENLKKAKKEIEKIITEFSNYIADCNAPFRCPYLFDDSISNKDNWINNAGYEKNDPSVHVLYENIEQVSNKISDLNKKQTYLLFLPYVHFFVEKIIRVCSENQWVITDDEVKKIIENELKFIPQKIGRFIAKYYDQRGWDNLLHKKACLPEVFQQLKEVCKFFKIQPDNILKDFGLRVGEAIDFEKNIKIQSPLLSWLFFAKKVSSKTEINKLPKPVIGMIVDFVIPKSDSEEQIFKEVKFN
ncbi:MAG: hypothetical protein HYX60_00730 [Legionella longbeachae]|nr:hypothetical protein [Legionella longbeachae]